MDGVGDVGGVVGGVAGVEVYRVVGAGDFDRAFLDGEEFAGAFEMGGAAEGGSGLEGDFVVLDGFFEVEWGEGADAAMAVVAEVVGPVGGADDVDLGGRGGGGFDELAEG